MKRLLKITAILSVAALVPSAAQAQRGGMGGGHGVASAHVGGGAAARPAGIGAMGAVRPAGMRVAAGHSRFVPRRTFVPRNRFVFNRSDRFRHRRFFNNCFNTSGFGCGGPFLNGGLGLGYPLYDPFFNDYGSEFQQPQQQPVAEENEGDNDRETSFAVQALRDEILAMREESRAREQARNNTPARSAAQDDGSNAVLVFRDGRQLSVRNYAISDHTVWVLSPNSARKIPVTELDVPATQQMNAKNGVEFHLPPQ
jgi:hypothetical protein